MRISEEAMKLNDREMLEDLIAAATNQALTKVRQQLAEESAKMAANIGLAARHARRRVAGAWARWLLADSAEGPRDCANGERSGVGTGGRHRGAAGGVDQAPRHRAEERGADRPLPALGRPAATRRPWPNACGPWRRRSGRAASASTSTDGELCPICRDPKRDAGLLCVVETPRDVGSFERAGNFRGPYHVLGGRLAPLDGMGPERLDIHGAGRAGRSAAGCGR